MTERPASESEQPPAGKGNGQATGAATSEEKRHNRNLITSLFHKAASKVGIIEQTRLSPELLAEIDKYHKYQQSVDDLVGQLEATLQQNPKILTSGAIESPEKEDPHETLARAIKHFRRVMPEDKKAPLTTAEAIVKRLALMNREYQQKGRRSICKMKRFISSEYESMLAEQKSLMDARDTMDAARHDVKKAHTTAEVEERGRIYEQSVNEFSDQAEKVMVTCVNVEQDKTVHRRELFDFLRILEHHHKYAALMLADHLKPKAAVVQAPKAVVAQSVKK